jgi:hypothetical protein
MKPTELKTTQLAELISTHLLEGETSNEIFPG